MILHGVVGRGQGLASRREFAGHPVFSELLGVPIHPGSINLFVTQPGAPT
jgi:hypothetical protein